MKTTALRQVVATFDTRTSTGLYGYQHWFVRVPEPPLESFEWGFAFAQGGLTFWNLIKIPPIY